tara:strand:- start:13 stop:501 length:489 start_codon:yes stop_codon:yes gene_type:complete
VRLIVVFCLLLVSQGAWAGDCSDGRCDLQILDLEGDVSVQAGKVQRFYLGYLNLAREVIAEIDAKGYILGKGRINVSIQLLGPMGAIQVVYPHPGRRIKPDGFYLHYLPLIGQTEGSFVAIQGRSTKRLSGIYRLLVINDGGQPVKLHNFTIRIKSKSGTYR